MPVSVQDTEERIEVVLPQRAQHLVFHEHVGQRQQRVDVIFGRSLGSLFERPAVGQRLIESAEVSLAGLALDAAEVVLRRHRRRPDAEILEHIRSVDTFPGEQRPGVADLPGDHRGGDIDLGGRPERVLGAPYFRDGVLFGDEAAAILPVLGEVVQDNPVFVRLGDKGRREVDAAEDVDRIQLLGREGSEFALVAVNVPDDDPAAVGADLRALFCDVDDRLVEHPLGGFHTSPSQPVPRAFSGSSIAVSSGMQYSRAEQASHFEGLSVSGGMSSTDSDRILSMILRTVSR